MAQRSSPSQDGAAPTRIGRTENRLMATTPIAIGSEPIDDHESARREVAVALTARRLQMSGLTLAEASNLTAHLAGLPPARTGWNLRQVEHLLFLRSIVEGGRIAP
jgi:hypothetical protein